MRVSLRSYILIACLIGGPIALLVYRAIQNKNVFVIGFITLFLLTAGAAGPIVTCYTLRYWSGSRMACVVASIAIGMLFAGLCFRLAGDVFRVILLP